MLLSLSPHYKGKATADLGSKLKTCFSLCTQSDLSGNFVVIYYLFFKMAGMSNGTITLAGGFSPINEMVFLGKSRAKGICLYKCKRLFNVREVQKPGENLIITARIIKSAKLKEAWNLRFEVDPVTLGVFKACCSCCVGSSGQCKHFSALLKYINSEHPEGKTDKEQALTTPS